MEQKKQGFLKRKNIEFSAKRYFNDALSAMALGLFASLLIGLIIKTIGEQSGILLGENTVSAFLVESGATAMSMAGAAIGAAVAYGLQAPPLVLFSSIITGFMGNAAGGPAGAFLAAAIGAEFGKAVSKETKVDIIVTPATTILTGAVGAAAWRSDYVGHGTAALYHGNHRFCSGGAGADGSDFQCSPVHYAEPRRPRRRCSHSRMLCADDRLCGNDV